MAVLLALAIVLLAASWRTDNQSAESERQAVLSSLEAHANQMRQAMAAVVMADENNLLERLAAGDSAFLDTHVTRTLKENFGYDYTFLVDAAGAVVFGPDAIGETSPVRQWIEPVVRRMAGEDVPPFVLVNSGRRAGILVGRRLAATRPGQPEALPLMLVTVDLLDEGLLRELSAPVGVAGLHVDVAERHPGEARIAFPNLANDSDLYLSWTPRDPARALLRDALPAVTALTTLLSAVFLALLVRQHHTRRALLESEARALALAYQDYLTGLSNRAHLVETLGERLRTLGQGDTLTLLFIDLDGFKEINDTLGHGVGDQLLQVVAKRLTDWITETGRAGDSLAARFGGDEFVMFSVVPHGRLTEQDLTGLSRALNAPIHINGSELRISACVGAAAAPKDAQTASELMRVADITLYQAKAAGRASHCFFEPRFEQALLQRRRVELDLASALERGELYLVYQPQVDVESERVVGFEALVRWDHPTQGRLPPSEFVPVAEATRLIDRLDAYVLRRACREAAAFEGVTVAVNMSPLSLRRHGVADEIEATLRETGFDPHRLEIEITESAIIGGDPDTLEALRRLRELGVRIALDDFGTGHASLVHVRRFPISKIKIDRSFTQNLGTQRDAASIVEYVVRLGRSLGITLTVEGVETREQLRFLRAFGAQQVQGYLFSPPLPLAAAAAMLDRQRQNERSRLTPRRPHDGGDVVQAK